MNYYNLLIGNFTKVEDIFHLHKFLLDWWNSNSFPEYYRKWNGVVYDWLYNYVYVDTISLLESFSTTKKYSKALASFFVIQFSAAMHEFILAFALGHWFPALWLTYGGPGILFNYLNKNSRNKVKTLIHASCLFF